MTYSSSPLRVSQDDGNTSRFTYRDLRLLSQSSVKSPLRVIALVDFDCFYAQCEAVRLGIPDDQPLGVQQFKHVIAINYPARAAGLKKVVTAVEAKQKCPNIVLQHVPTWREGDNTWAYRDDALQFMDSDKSSLDYYRLQSRRAIDVVKRTLPTDLPQRIEKAGIDEVFLDLSAQVHAILVKRNPELILPDGSSLDRHLPKPPSEILEWHEDKVIGTEDVGEDQRTIDWDDVALNIGSEVVRHLRSEIRSHLRYTCSAGIACNKVIAKLAAGHNKPNGQTVVRSGCVTTFLSTYKFTKLRGLGGKLGSKAAKTFKTEFVTDLLQVSLKTMQAELGPESGLWLFRVIRGMEYGPVVTRTLIKSMLSAKTFTPSITGLEQAEKWLRIFAADIMGRIDEQEGRRPRTIAVHHQPNGRFGPTLSKQAPIPLGSKLDIDCLFRLSREVLSDVTRAEQSWPCLTLSVSVSDFFDTETSSHSLTSFWSVPAAPDQGVVDSDKPEIPEDEEPMPARRNKRTIADYQSSSLTKTALHVSEVRTPRIDTAFKRQRNSITDEHAHVDSEVDTSTSELEGQYRCPTCAKAIPASDVLEHLDWHVAVDLQDQV